MNWQGGLIGGCLALLAHGAAIAAGQPLDIRVAHPDGIALALSGIDIGADAITIAAAIANSGDGPVRLDAAHSLFLEDGAGNRYRLNPPRDNPELRIGPRARLTGSLVFIGPLASGTRQLTVSANAGIGSRDNPYDQTPVLGATLAVHPPDAGRSARPQAHHPDGVTLRLDDVASYPAGFVVRLTATNGNDREIRLDTDDSLVVIDAAGATLPMQKLAANPALAVPPGDRLDATLVFPAKPPGSGKITLSTNAGTGGTADNPYDTMPVFKLAAAIDREVGDAALPTPRAVVAPLARSTLAEAPAPAAVASAPEPARPPAAPAPKPAAPPAPSRVEAAPKGKAAAPDTPAAVAADQGQPNPPVSAMSTGQLEQALHAEHTDRGWRVMLPADALFGAPVADAPSSGDTIHDAAAAMLQEMARLIAAIHPRQIVVAGHTDGTGSDDADLVLSQQRAHAVAAWLAAHDGHQLPHPVEKGYGRTRPLAPNHNADGSDNVTGRAKNRRVEIWLRG